jgi:DNA-directed RNA polymerase subunit RPC12/RpoP
MNGSSRYLAFHSYASNFPTKKGAAGEDSLRPTPLTKLFPCEQGQHILDVAVAYSETKLEPNGLLDDDAWKAVRRYESLSIRERYTAFRTEQVCYCDSAIRASTCGAQSSIRASERRGATVRKPQQPAMTKAEMREQSDRLVKEAMQKNLTVTQGKTRMEVRCGKCGAPNKVSADSGQARVDYKCKQCGHEQKSF